MPNQRILKNIAIFWAWGCWLWIAWSQQWLWLLLSLIPYFIVNALDKHTD